MSQAPYLQVMTLRCEARALDTVHLPPFTGATLRGVMGRALRERSCITELEDCATCPALPGCSYGRFWETPARRVPDVALRGAAPPKSYVLEPPIYQMGRELAFGERLVFHLRLFGEARSHAVHFVQALASGLVRGVGRGQARMELLLAVAEGDGGEVAFYEDGRRVLPSGPLPSRRVAPDLKAEGRHSNVELEIATPLHLTRRGHTLESFDPRVFTIRLAERFEALSALYEGLPYQRLGSELITQAKQVRVKTQTLTNIQFERYSNRSRKRIPMSGVMGRVSLEHVSPEVLSLWRCAEHLHVGKQATFGFGRVHVRR